MTLRERQSEFALAVSYLIQYAYDLGYEITLGDAYRDPRSHGEMGSVKAYGRASSNHKARLAIDLNLFQAGKYLSDTEAHRPLGEWWEQQYAEFDSAWGGRWEDGNHYSFEYQGRK